MNFDNDAKAWDTDERSDRAKIVANEISNSIDINNDYSAMEFGCGTGLISFNLYDKFKSITLVDSSKGMIDILKSKIDKYKVNNMFPCYLDITNGNLLNKKFDVIYNSMVLHHIDDIEALIRNFYELLNKDGYLCIVDLNEEDGSFHKDNPDFHGHNGFNQEHLKSILINAGFKDVESRTFFYGEKIVKGEKVQYSMFLMKGRI